MRFWGGGDPGRADDDNLAMGVCKADSGNVFYAIWIGLALVGEVDELITTIAWTYVGFRIAYSLLQISSNRLLPRFLLFALSVSPPWRSSPHARCASGGGFGCAGLGCVVCPLLPASHPRT